MKAQLAGHFLLQNTDILIDEISSRLKNKNSLYLTDFQIDLETMRSLIKHDISKLFLAIISQRTTIFTHYLQWQRSVLETRHIPLVVIIQNYEVFKNTIIEKCDIQNIDLITQYLNEGSKIYEKQFSLPSTFLDDTTEIGNLAKNYLALLLDHNRNQAINEILYKLNSISPEEIYLKIIRVVLYEVGRLWQINKITPAQEHYATNTTFALMEKLSSHFQSNIPYKKKILTACTAGEQHSLGLKVVSDYFALNGWKPYYTGANTPINGILNIVSSFQPDIVAFSVSTAPGVHLLKTTIQSIRNLDNRVKILVGGYLFNEEPEYVKYVEADGFAHDIKEALALAKTMVL